MPRKISSCMDSTRFQEHYLSLTNQQKELVDTLQNWIQQPRKMLVTVSGGPGTGKTYAVKKTLEFVDMKQLRMSYTARSAYAIGGRTIHSTVHLDWSPDSLYKRIEKELENEPDLNECIEKSRCILDEFNYIGPQPDIVVVDEVSMINAWLMYWLVRFFMDRSRKPVLFIAMGDQHQLSPVRSPYNLFSITQLDTLYETHFVRLVDNKRFKPEYQVLIDRLSQHVQEEDVTGLFTYILTNFPVVESITSETLMQADRAMALKNATVNNYNRFYLKCMVPGKMVRLYKCTPERVVEKDYIDVKPGCRIVVNENILSRQSGSVMNGTQLTFNEYDAISDVLRCVECGTRKIVNIERNHSTGKFPIDLGFAATVHKFQGETIDSARIVINFDKSENVNLVYTALSRVRDMSQIIAIQL